MPNIISITLNSAIDYIIEIDDFYIGSVLSSKKSFLFPSGKAINSTRTVSCLNHDIEAICFVGKTEAHFYNRLKSKRVHLKLYEVDGITRSNITIVNGRHDLIMHLKTHGYKLTAKELIPFSNHLEKIIKKGDIVIISGSLPDGISAAYYKELIKLCNSKGGKVLFDSREIYLKHGLNGKPYVIKPNIEEIEELMGKKNVTVSELVKYGHGLNEKGIELVFISRGKDGVILTKRENKGYWIANVQLPNKKHEGDEIGCGDAMIGGIAVALSKQLAIDELLVNAVATGAANILSKGPGIVRIKDVKNLSKLATVTYFEE